MKLKFEKKNYDDYDDDDDKMCSYMFFFYKKPLDEHPGNKTKHLILRRS